MERNMKRKLGCAGYHNFTVILKILAPVRYDYLILSIIFSDLKGENIWRKIQDLGFHISKMFAHSEDRKYFEKSCNIFTLYSPWKYWENTPHTFWILLKYFQQIYYIMHPVWLLGVARSMQWHAGREIGHSNQQDKRQTPTPHNHYFKNIPNILVKIKAGKRER